MVVEIDRTLRGEGAQLLRDFGSVRAIQEKKNSKTMHVLIAGTRGIPAQHGGFETFAEDLSLFLAQRGHNVTVYCQEDGQKRSWEDEWCGVRRVHFSSGSGAAGTMLFDWMSVRHSLKEDGIVLTLGYNTGIFSLLYRLSRKRSLMNMDGIEWKRQKWSRLEQAWLWLNERAGALAANHLIADHPQIALHLQRHTRAEKITTIPYGANIVKYAPLEPLHTYGLEPGEYYLLVARAEPENSILEIVRAYSQRKRSARLAVLGNYKPERNAYQKKVMESASERVSFLGAIYESRVVSALRFHAAAYLHGHTVGGTNPSLVEALAAGNAVIAHDNPFNRWVAGSSAAYFSDTTGLAEIFDRLESDPNQLVAMRDGSRTQHRDFFRQEEILGKYEQVLSRVSAAEAQVANYR
jgi:glycosyltransferase involved in cell wall biosynthesis